MSAVFATAAERGILPRTRRRNGSSVAPHTPLPRPLRAGAGRRGASDPEPEDLPENLLSRVLAPQEPRAGRRRRLIPGRPPVSSAPFSRGRFTVSGKPCANHGRKPRHVRLFCRPFPSGLRVAGGAGRRGPRRRRPVLGPHRHRQPHRRRGRRERRTFCRLGRRHRRQSHAVCPPRQQQHRYDRRGQRAGRPHRPGDRRRRRARLPDRHLQYRHPQRRGRGLCGL